MCYTDLFGEAVGFVSLIGRVGERHGESPNRAMACGEFDHRTRVDAPGEERPERSIGNQVPGDGIGQRVSDEHLEVPGCVLLSRKLWPPPALDPRTPRNPFEE